MREREYEYVYVLVCMYVYFGERGHLMLPSSNPLPENLYLGEKVICVYGLNHVAFGK